MIKFRQLTKKGVWCYIEDEINEIPDGRALVITLHLWFEYFIEGVIKSELKFHEEIDWDNWSFAKKRELAYGMGHIKKTMNDDLIKLTRIRNDYAHNIQPNILKLVKNLKGHSKYPPPSFSPPKSSVTMYEFWKVKYVMMKTLEELLDLWWKHYNKK